MYTTTIAFVPPRRVGWWRVGIRLILIERGEETDSLKDEASILYAS
jgi:hypothetical protein